MLSSQLTPIIVPAVLWGLVGLSIVTWALFLLKLIQFGRSGALDRRFQRKFWSADTLAEGEAIADRVPGPKANIAQAGFAVVTGRDIAPGNRDLAHQIDRGDRLHRVLRQRIARERRALEGGLAVLASFGSTAPFIGLFGTVWGIMGALVSIHKSGSTGLQAVAGPVGHALIATGLGIAVAVPAVLIYNFLVRRLKMAAHSMNDFAEDFYALCEQNGFNLEVAKDGRSTNRSNLAEPLQKAPASA